MNFIPYPIFVYINYVVFLCISLSSWFLTLNNFSFNIFLSLTGVVALVVLALSVNKQFPKLDLIPIRMVQLVVFTLSVLISFSHYFFRVDNSNLILLILIAPAISLLTLIFVDTESKV